MFEDIEIEKNKFFSGHKSPVLLKDQDIEKLFFWRRKL